MRQVAPGVFDDLLEGNAGIRKPTLQCARTRAQFSRDVRKRWAFPRETSLERVLHLFPDLGPGIPRRKLCIQLGPNRRQQIFIVGCEWPIEVAAAKNKRVAPGFEPHPAAIMGFQQLPVLGGTGEFQSQRRDLSIGAPASDGCNP